MRVRSGRLRAISRVRASPVRVNSRTTIRRDRTARTIVTRDRTTITSNYKGHVMSEQVQQDY